jgi:hypothetical protein
MLKIMLDDCFNYRTSAIDRAYPWGAQDIDAAIGKPIMNEGNKRQGHNRIPNPMRGDNEDAWHSEAPFWDDLSDREVRYQESRDIQCRNTGI